jgi:cytosine/adenosine deaminase-related metal-dependent hydrolase
MCQFCESRVLRGPSRRNFLKGLAAGAAAVPALPFLTATTPARAQGLPEGVGGAGRRTIIRGGAVLSMDPAVGDFPSADVLLDGSRILEIRPNIEAANAAVIDASGMIVMPGFIDTHHHQFETALRSYLADGLLFNDGKPHGTPNYLEHILGKLSVVYRPEDVYINELLASLSQLDGGVTTVLDVSQIHHSPEHSDAAIKGLQDAGRRSAFGYFEGSGGGMKYPQDAHRIKKQYFSSDNQLLTMVMGGEFYLPSYQEAWKIGRELNIPIALHVVASRKVRADAFDQLARSGVFKSDNIFIHMTGVSDYGWKTVKDAGAHISLAVPIEMMMRHGMPPIIKAMEMGMPPSLSTDVECTMTADFFTQMRSALTLQRALVNEAAIAGKADLPPLLTSREVIGFATVEGAKALGLDRKVGSLTPGKEADLILLDAGAINVTPLNNVPGAVVTLMDRGNVDTVLVAGKIRKWRGRLLDADIAKLRTDITASRDYLFSKAGVERKLF